MAPTDVKKIKFNDVNINKVFYNDKIVEELDYMGTKVAFGSHVTNH